jgi:hypothetical protein
MDGQHVVTAELSTSSRARARATLAATAALYATTAGGALAGAIAPGLVSRVAPHPTLTPSLAAWAAILLDNSRVLALPILLTAFSFHRGRYSARIGDIAIIGVLGANAIFVGLELGRWQNQLLPYLPQLPLEWLAAGTAAGVWTHARSTAGQTGHRALAVHAAVVLGLLMAAAALEVLATPRAGGIRT